MRWGDSDHQFVRPVHGLILLHGERRVPGEVLGLTSRTVTRGHRFLSTGEITIDSPADYAETLLAGARSSPALPNDATRLPRNSTPKPKNSRPASIRPKACSTK